MALENKGFVPDGAEDFVMKNTETDATKQVASLAELRDLGKESMRASTEKARENLEGALQERMSALQRNADAVKAKAGGLRDRLRQFAAQGKALVKGGASVAARTLADTAAVGYALAARPEGRAYVADKARQGVETVSNTINYGIDRATETAGNIQEAVEQRAAQTAENIQRGVDNAIEATTNKIAEVKTATKERVANTINAATVRSNLAISGIKNSVLKARLDLLANRDMAMTAKMERNADKIKALLEVRRQVEAELRTLGARS